MRSQLTSGVAMLSSVLLTFYNDRLYVQVKITNTSHEDLRAFCSKLSCPRFGAGRHLRWNQPLDHVRGECAFHIDSLPRCDLRRRL